MPNWTENTLSVQGKEEDINKFKEKARAKKTKFAEKTDLSLNNFIPMPEKLRNTTSPRKKPSKTLIEKYGYDNWYDWSLNNWGIKWDIVVILFCDDETKLGYAFDSSWASPVMALKEIAKQYPKLKFTLGYKEDGMRFCGGWRAENGKTVMEEGQEIIW